MSLTSNLADQLKHRLGISCRNQQDPKNICFNTIQAKEEAYQTVNRGIHEVQVKNIKGSVGRYQDFDSQFRMKRSLARSERYHSVLAAMVEGTALAPVSLYQIKDNYFVLDGHHRVAATRELGYETIRAKIVELLPSKKSLENILYLEQTSFRDKVGLVDTIRLTLPGQFHALEEQIRQHQSYQQKDLNLELDIQEAARDWYRTIYRPLATIIDNSGLVKKFPGRTVDDLYLYISTHQWQNKQTRHYGIGIDQLIPRDMEAFRKKMIDRQQADYPEMQRKITFFILMNIDGRLEGNILDKLMVIPEVREAHTIHGFVDILVKVVIQRDLLSSDAEQIALFTRSQIRKIKGVNSTQTLIPGLSRDKEEEK